MTASAVEQRMKDEGVARFRRQLQIAREKSLLSQIGGAKRLTDKVVPVLAEAVVSFIEQSKARAGRSHSAVVLLEKVDPGVAAFIAAKTVFDGIGKTGRLQVVAHQVGGRIEDEVRFRAFKQQSPKHYRYLMKKVQQSRDYRYRHRVLAHAAVRDEEVAEWVSWTPRERTNVGIKLIELMIESTEVIEIKRHTTGVRKRKNSLVPTADCLAAIEAGDHADEIMHPWFLPMLSPPRDWTTPFDGGYETIPLLMVKSRHARTRAYFKTLREAEMPEVYAAVNALQHTAWCINRDVLETLEELWGMHLEVAGLPAQEEKALPERLDWMTEALKIPKAERPEPDDYQKLELKAWKQAASRIYLANAQRLSHVIATVKVREVAREFATQQAIYFPHQLDWRGRAYAVPLFLQPQGADLARGLLQFAEGRAFGSAEAVNWWKIHGSNTWGFDKAPFADRVAWVDDHAEEIVAVANDPVTERMWCEAEEPWQFLAFCLEYARWTEGGQQLDFVSHIPVSMDGSCNGLQHLSALMKDEVGAEATNLLPSETPQDIYARVCQRVEEAVLRDTRMTATEVTTGKMPDQASLARQWYQSGLLTRDVVKRQVMTRPYGATLRGMFGQLTEYLSKLARKLPNGLPFEEETGWDACQYLTPRIWEAINEVVEGAQVCMGWLQECARVLSKHEMPLRWVAPTGFPVEQAYPVMKLRTIDTILLGTRYQLNVKEENRNKLDKRKQAAGVSPNYVHSMDSAHMVLTMAAMKERGASWAMVHDSFGCHAADAPHLAVTLRSTFVNLYEDGQALARWRAQVGAVCPDELPEVPEAGSLDLEAVRSAMFFFA